MSCDTRNDLLYSMGSLSSARVREHRALDTEGQTSMQPNLTPYGYCQCGCGNKTPLAPKTNTRDRHVKGQPTLFCLGHRRGTPIHEMYAIEDRGHDTPCWVWQRAIRPDGYGAIGRHGRVTTAYRYIYEMMRGPVAQGLTLDHLCRVRACVNPSHLEPVTRGENVLRGESPAAQHARQTHCKNGHEFVPANTIRSGRGRRCRTCRTAWREAYER